MYDAGALDLFDDIDDDDDEIDKQVRHQTPLKYLDISYSLNYFLIILI